MSKLAVSAFRASNQVLGRVFPEWTAARAKDVFMRPRRAGRRHWEADVERRAERITQHRESSALSLPRSGQGAGSFSHGLERVVPHVWPPCALLCSS